MYVLIKDGAVDRFPYSKTEFFDDHRATIAFPEGFISDQQLEAWGLFQVESSPMPEYDVVTQKCIPATPTLDTETSKWVGQWEIVELEGAEAFAASTAFKALVVLHCQNKLDEFARTRGYDNIGSATAYVTSAIEAHRLEAERCVLKRDEVWMVLRQLESNAINGESVPHTVAGIEALLPALTWED